MKILFLTNNEVARPLYDWIKDKQNCEVALFEEKINTEIVSGYSPDIIISYNYRYIIKKDVIDLMTGRIINLHISYLPWNRGANPNLWSFLEGTPKGVTIHLIDEGIDTGKILVQKKLELDENIETWESSYSKLNFEIQKLFKENWELLKDFKIQSKAQYGAGSVHLLKDFEIIKDLIVSWKENIKDTKSRYLEYLEVFKSV